MENQIDQIARNTRRYWFEDGFVEIAWGILLTVGAVFEGALEFIPHSSLWFPITVIGLPLLVIAASIPIWAFVRTFKEHVTYPRTGYVSLHRNVGRSFLTTMVVALGTALAIMIWDRLLNHEVYIVGLVLAAAFTSLGWRFGAQRLYALAALAVVLGFAVSLLLNLAESLRIAVLLAGTGVGAVTSGLLVLRRYLGQHPLSEEISHG
jgi:hypothetical protein